MKIFSYSLVKKKEVDTLHHKMQVHEKDAAGATEFVKAIEQGNLDIRYNGDDQVDEGNTLAISLISMRDQMKKFSQEERQRTWVSEGLAKFADILRDKSEEIQELSNDIISNLVKYMDANQGALYIINDDDTSDVFLEMKACYAYERKKHIDKRIPIGEGIVGQVVLEKSSNYMKAIPADFIKITSGLGASLPRYLLIVPLKLEEQVLGVVEIASFVEIKQYQIDFVEKLGESIASTVSSVKVNDRTRKLLNETQAQAEQMRSQEEEMRQNMEELSATQEEMHRVLTEVQGKERYMIDLIDSATDSILTVGRDYKVINCNSVFKKTYSGSGVEIDKGFDILQLMATAEEKDKNRAYYERVFNGESFEMTDQYTLNGQISHFVVSYSPLRNDKGEVIAAAIFVKDITQVTKAKNEAQHQTEELKSQEEELRQNMEELSATQEEMHRVLTEVQSKEQFMNALIDSSRDAILTIDRDYRIVTGNANFKAMFAGSGLNVDKGTDIMVLMNTEEEKNLNIGYYKRAFAGESFDITQQVVVTGHPMYMTISYNPIRNEKGEVTSVAIFTKDVTQVTVAREEAEQKEKYLDEVLNSSTDSIFTLDRDYKILSFNKAFSAGLEGLGVTVQKGFDLMAIFPDPETQKKQRDIYARAFNGERFELTTEYNMNGTVSHFLNTHSPLRNDKGEIFAIACFAKDVTDRVNLQKQT